MTFYCNTASFQRAMSETKVVSYSPPETFLVMRSGAKSFHNNNTEASKKHPPPTSPLVGGVEVLKEM